MRNCFQPNASILFYFSLVYYLYNIKMVIIFNYNFLDGRDWISTRELLIKIAMKLCALYSKEMFLSFLIKFILFVCAFCLKHIFNNAIIIVILIVVRFKSLYLQTYFVCVVPRAKREKFSNKDLNLFNKITLGRCKLKIIKNTEVKLWGQQALRTF